MKDRKDGQALGIAFTLLGGTLWGLCGSCGQFLFQYKNVTSDWLVPLRLTGAGAIILLALTVKSGSGVLELWREPRGRRDILIFALVGMMLCQYSYFTTIQYSNAGTATVLQYTGPAMILVYLCARSRRKPKLYELAGLFCSMLGTFILATHGNVSELAIPVRALLWGMVSAVALVVYTLQPAYLMKKYSTLLTLGWGMLLGGLVLMVLRRPWTVRATVDVQTVAAMAVIILLGTITAFYLYLTGVQTVGASNASMLACIEPVAATVSSVVWLKVQFQAVDLVGFVFVLSTVFIISLNQKREQKSRTAAAGVQN
ncbi:MAG: DMT family transporter [Eubacteriales bacterium]|nr:DMT family transporter [Eubacteriales bacterium]